MKDIFDSFAFDSDRRKWHYFLFWIMKRLSAILLALLFITGALIVPFIHQACCADEHATHDAGHCLICQTAHTPFQLSAVILAPVDTVRMVDTLIPAARFIPQFSPRTATQARAPPA